MTGQSVLPAPRRIVYTRIDGFKPHPRNSKKHDLPSLCESITRYGFTEPVLVCERTGYTAAGHGRVEALAHLRATGYPGTPEGIVLDDDGEWCVPTIVGWASRDDMELRGYVITSNRLTEAGGWNTKRLAEELHEIGHVDPSLFDSLGFTADEMDELIRGIDPDRLDQGPEGAAGEVPDAGDGESGGRAQAQLVGCPECGSVFKASESTI